MATLLDGSPFDSINTGMEAAKKPSSILLLPCIVSVFFTRIPFLTISSLVFVYSFVYSSAVFAWSTLNEPFASLSFKISLSVLNPSFDNVSLNSFNLFLSSFETYFFSSALFILAI